MPAIGGSEASGVAPARVTIAASERPPAITRATTPSGGLRYCSTPATAEANSTASARPDEQRDLVVLAEGRDRELLERLRHDVDDERSDREDRAALPRDQQRDQFGDREEHRGAHDARRARPAPRSRASFDASSSPSPASASAGSSPTSPLVRREAVFGWFAGRARCGHALASPRSGAVTASVEVMTVTVRLATREDTRAIATVRCRPGVRRTRD